MENGSVNAGQVAGSDRGLGPSTEAAEAQPTRTVGRADRSAPVRQAEVFPGTGIFLGPPSDRASGEILDTEDGVMLNFVRTEIDGVAAAILGDYLKRNYIIDPEVTGSITIQTSRPLPRDALLPALEAALRLNNAAIVQTDSLYKIVPLSKATDSGVPVRARSPVRGHGFSVLIAPLRYVSAAEMEKILAPVALTENILRVDEVRNVLVLSGTEDELEALQDVIDIFDVDWLSGMSFGLFRLRFVDPLTIIETLERIFFRSGGDSGPGLVQFVPIERVNAVLVISRRSGRGNGSSGWTKAWAARNVALSCTASRTQGRKTWRRPCRRSSSTMGQTRRGPHRGTLSRSTRRLNRPLRERTDRRRWSLLCRRRRPRPAPAVTALPCRLRAGCGS